MNTQPSRWLGSGRTPAGHATIPSQQYTPPKATPSAHKSATPKPTRKTVRIEDLHLVQSERSSVRAIFTAVIYLPEWGNSLRLFRCRLVDNMENVFVCPPSEQLESGEGGEKRYRTLATMPRKLAEAICDEFMVEFRNLTGYDYEPRGDAAQ